MIAPRADIAALAPYALANLSVAAGVNPISLAQNESAWGPSPFALKAAQRAMAEARLYPDPDWTDLRAAIAEVHDVDPATVLIGAGSMELITALISAYAGPGDQVVSTAHAYALFRSAAAMTGADYTAAPEQNLNVSVDAILSAVTPETKLVAVASPGNPTGTRIGRVDLIRLRDRLPKSVLLLIDEAYGEFSDTPPMFDLAGRGDTVILRTFSKAYALAGLRIGWGVFPPTIGAEVRKLLNPNNVTGPAQAAAAAAMRDRAYLAGIVEQTAAVRAHFCTGLDRLGICHIPGHTNFVLVRLGDASATSRADRALRARGIIARGMAGYGLPDALRITIGQRKDMDATLAALADWQETKDTT